MSGSAETINSRQQSSFQRVPFYSNTSILYSPNHHLAQHHELFSSSKSSSASAADFDGGDRGDAGRRSAAASPPASSRWSDPHGLFGGRARFVSSPPSPAPPPPPRTAERRGDPGGGGRSSGSDSPSSSSSSSAAGQPRTRPARGPSWRPPPVSPWPIRHWWALHHNKRSLPQQQQYPKCLPNSDLNSSSSSSHGGVQHSSPALSVHGGPSWARRVCSASALDDRVRLLLSESPCRRHRVCQVLSPTDLQRVASDATCMEEVRHKWWKLFHKVDKILVDFEQAFTKKLDSDRYSVKFQVDQCRVRITLD